MPTRRTQILAGSSILVALALALGIGLGVGLNNDDDNNSKSANSAARDSQNNAQTNAKDSTKNAANNAASATVTPFEKWNWQSDKMIGMATGNHLVLERWMYEDWFTGLAGPNAWDEWTFTEALGDNATNALEDHWSSWLTNDDIASIASAGFNHLRIPTGFWQWIPTEGDEPYVTTGQKAQLDRMVEAAYNNKLYVLLDLHGMPGNQNGEQQSGHNTSDIQFYSDGNQARSDATVQAALNYMTSSEYSSIFSGLGIVNEPHPWTQAQLDTLEQFYERSYKTLSAAGVTTVFHHAFQGIDYWRPFLAGKDPSLIVAEDHPYPGNFPLQNNADDIINQVCNKASGYAEYPVPVAVTEYSLTTGITTPDFEKRFFKAQVEAWNWSAGSTFWSYKTIKSDNPVLADPETIAQYSYVDLISTGSLEQPSTWSDSTDSTACGQAPSMSWASPVPAASSTPSSSFAKRRRTKRKQNIH